MAKMQVISFDAAKPDVMTIDYQLIGERLVVDTAKLPFPDEARRYGWKQRFGDLKSGDKTKGREKFEEAKRLLEHLLTPGCDSWNMSGERDTTSEVIAALHRINPRKYPVEKLQKAVEFDPDQVKDWRADPRVASMLATIRAEKAKAKADAAEESDIEINLK